MVAKRLINRLTVSEVRNLKNPGKYADGDGLYLHISKTGTKTWQYKFKFPGGIEKTYTIGRFEGERQSSISLKAARAERDRAKSLKNQGINPTDERAARIKAKAVESADAGSKDTFGAIAEDFMRFKRSEWSSTTYNKFKLSFDKHLMPVLGVIPVTEITTVQLKAVLDDIAATTTQSTAGRSRMRISQVLDHAIASGYLEMNVSTPLNKLFKDPKTGSQPAVTSSQEIGELLKALDSAEILSPTTKAALLLFPLVFLRHNEVIAAEWSEIDLKKKVWLVPRERMKVKTLSKQAHHVPLSAQAVQILKALSRHTGDGRYLFPSPNSSLKPVTQTTVLRALYDICNCKGRHTLHGWRSAASTTLNGARRKEGGRMWDKVAIELQMDHAARDVVDAAYDRSELIEERTAMMQWLADTYGELRVVTS